MGQEPGRERAQLSQGSQGHWRSPTDSAQEEEEERRRGEKTFYSGSREGSCWRRNRAKSSSQHHLPKEASERRGPIPLMTQRAYCVSGSHGTHLRVPCSPPMEAESVVFALQMGKLRLRGAN